MKIEAVFSYEISVNFYQTAWDHIPEYNILHATFDGLLRRLLMIDSLAKQNALIYVVNANMSVQKKINLFGKTVILDEFVPYV